MATQVAAFRAKWKAGRPGLWATKYPTNCRKKTDGAGRKRKDANFDLVHGC
jgi:hypothetical protein